MQDQEPTVVTEWAPGPSVRPNVGSVDPGLQRSVTLVVPCGVVELDAGSVEPDEVRVLQSSSAFEEFGLTQRRCCSA